MQPATSSHQISPFACTREHTAKQLADHSVCVCVCVCVQAYQRHRPQQPAPPAQQKETEAAPDQCARTEARTHPRANAPRHGQRTNQHASSTVHSARHKASSSTCARHCKGARMQVVVSTTLHSARTCITSVRGASGVRPAINLPC